MGAVLAHGSFFCYLICMKKILITAFEPFGGERINPAQAVLERLPEAISGAALYRSVLPVSYRKSAALLLEQIERVRPDAVVMLGQAGGRAKITPERIAVNLDHCEARDNDGEQRIDSVIDPEGPAAYFSTLPVHAMLQEMRKCEVGCAMSASAGAFVCNHVSYEVLHYISGETSHCHKTAGSALSAVAPWPYRPLPLLRKERRACVYTQRRMYTI